MFFFSLKNRECSRTFRKSRSREFLLFIISATSQEPLSHLTTWNPIKNKNIFWVGIILHHSLFWDDVISQKKWSKKINWRNRFKFILGSLERLTWLGSLKSSKKKSLFLPVDLIERDFVFALQLFTYPNYALGNNSIYTGISL